MYWTLLKHAREQGVDVSKRGGDAASSSVSGGAPMPVELMKDFEQAFGVRIIEGYGLSETAPVASFNHLDRPSKPGTVGQPLFAVEVMIVDDKDEPVRDRHAWRSRHSRPQRHEGLLQTARSDGRSDAQRLVSHGRHRHPGRRRLSHHRRSQERHDSERRFQRLPARDRRSDADPSGRVARGRHRRPRRAARAKR